MVGYRESGLAARETQNEMDGPVPDSAAATGTFSYKPQCQGMLIEPTTNISHVHSFIRVFFRSEPKIKANRAGIIYGLSR